MGKFLQNCRRVKGARIDNMATHARSIIDVTMTADGAAPNCEDSRHAVSWDDDTTHCDECFAHPPATARPAHVLAHAPALGIQLAAGCYIGTPVVAGIAVDRVPTDSKTLFQMAMRYVEWDDYQGLIEMARAGLAGMFDERRRCGFACDLKPGVSALFAGSVLSDVPHWLDVRNANLLHYAACIGAFNAASALLVICPDLLTAPCTVACFCDGNSTRRTVKWGATDLLRFFCDLYSTSGGGGEPLEEGVVVTGDMYRMALPVFELAELEPRRLPYLHLPTMHERIETAGFEAEVVLLALLSATRKDLDEKPMICE